MTDLLDNIKATKNVFWQNTLQKSAVEAAKLTRFTKVDIDDAEARLDRFAPYLVEVFPETKKTNGIIESELTAIPKIKEQLEEVYHTEIQGELYLKRDDSLPIAGTIKARGAIYEVLKHAETLVLANGLLKSTEEDYTIFASDEFKAFFAKHRIMVGTTGNLGISVGVMGARLGFDVTVHMSVEAKQWKKDMLRTHGVNVIEHNTNFTEAVENGRAQAEADPMCYFVDDEHSAELFLGYTVAGNRMKRQLEDMAIKVDEDHPLFVYLPCGIGGSPGGITFGLKQHFGDNVHCFFAEPAHMPSMLLGLATGKFDGVTVQEYGIEPKTVMDGLAVPRTSGLVAKLMQHYFDGGYTLQEEEAMYWLAKMVDTADIHLEPAALAGLPGAAFLTSNKDGQAYLADKGLTDKMAQATHIAWATGGSMVPQEDKVAFYLQGLQANITE